MPTGGAVDRLAAVVLGNRQSGKSTTWNTLFGQIVRTGKYQRDLWFNRCEKATVFLVSGSPEEREEYLGDLIAGEDPNILLSSLQYRTDVWNSFEYLLHNGFELYIQWLNPGYEDESKASDSLQLIDKLLDNGATVCIRSGKKNLERRVREINSFVYGWAKPRGLVVEDQGWA